MKFISATIINFPFRRGIEYRIVELIAFEERLSAERSANDSLNKELRASSKKSWIKTRNEELIAVSHYVSHKGIPGNGTFMIMLSGCKIDIRLAYSGKIDNLQITVADPKWEFPEPDHIKPSGQQQWALMTILNRDGFGGWGPVRKTSQGFFQDQRPVTTEQLLDSHREGLQDALIRKFQKDYGKGEITLLVYAREYREGLTVERFRTVVQDALDNAASHTRGSKSRFRNICVIGGKEDGYFFEDGDSRGEITREATSPESPRNN